jgi:hypothetical protein
MNHRTSRAVGTLLLAVLMAAGLYAQTSTSGAIEGRIMDASGPLPGVTVELSSPALQGTRVAVTGTDGSFRFSLLPPGVYTVATSLEGFGPVRQSNVQVSLGRVASLDIRMSPSALREAITVTAEAPIVDTTSARSGANVTAETIQTLPFARDFYAVAQVAAGTNEDAAGTTFHGSTGAENQYVIDGLNTTGIERGLEGKRLNFDFIQEVEVLTGGLPAEYGRITGGVINAITKSGGNEFTGDVFGYGAGGGLQSDDVTASDRPATTTTVSNLSEAFDYGFAVGGYGVKDRLWFFGAYNRVSDTRSDVRIQPLLVPGVGTFPAGTEFETDISRDIYAGKLTFRLSNSHSITGTILGDPTEAEGAVFAIAGPESTYKGTRTTGGTNPIVRYSGIFGTRFVVDALAGSHNEENVIGGPGRDIPQLRDESVVPAIRTGGFAFFQDQEFQRDIFKLDLSSFLGTHEIKFGGDQETLLASNANFYSGGGDLVYRLRARGPDNIANTPDDIIFYRHRFYIDSETFVRNDPSTWDIQYPLVAEPETINTSWYVQDSWRVIPNLTLNLGVRLENQDIKGRTGDTHIDINDAWSPRAGLIWDVLNNGRSKLYANFGRFYESVPMDINIRSFGGEVTVFSYNFDPTPGNFFPDATAPSRTSVLGGHTTPVDPDLKGQYIDEYLLGYEQEIVPNLSVGIKGTYRNLGRVIEDFLIPGTGDYGIANPGEGIGNVVGFYDYWHTYDLAFSAAPAPKAERKYTAVELTARRRFSNNLQFFASYVWSRLEGNYDGVFQVSTGQLDPNINSAFDYADFLINTDGLLSNDRTHQLKFYGSYIVPSGALNGLTLGLGTYYTSGVPLTAMGYSFLYQNHEYYLSPRGSLGRGPAAYEADIHVGYPVRFGGVETNLLLDVFNVLDRQAATNVDQRYNLAAHGPCGGVPEEICNGDNGLLHQPGSLQPVGQLTNARATAPNPDFLKAGTAFTPARSIRLGVRVSF